MKIKIVWSCGVRPLCEHKTKLGAWLHILCHWPRIGPSQRLLFVSLLLLSLPRDGHAQERVKDKKYWLMVSAAAGAGTADLAITRNCLNKYPPMPEHRIGDVFYGPTAGCTESTPGLGTYPSSGRLIGTGLAVHGGAAYLSYRLKKARKWYWWTPQAVLIGAHVAGALSFRGAHGYPKLPGRP